jgi:hypothetical protein
MRRTVALEHCVYVRGASRQIGRFQCPGGKPESEMLSGSLGGEDSLRDALQHGNCAAAPGISFARTVQEPSRLRRRCGTIRSSRQGEVMTQARYFVVQHGDVWMIKFDDEEYGPYKSKNEAMLFAIDAAQKLGEHGENAEVVILGENNHVRPEWVYGRDPYPPRLSGV